MSTPNRYLTDVTPLCYYVGMTERYDIRPTPDNWHWEVFDTRNGNGVIEVYPTHAQALAEAKRLERRSRRR
jgi:hypothetical protein